MDHIHVIHVQLINIKRNWYLARVESKLHTNVNYVIRYAIIKNNGAVSVIIRNIETERGFLPFLGFLNCRERLKY